jgi:ATP-binding cassette subfamily B protein
MLNNRKNKSTTFIITHKIMSAKDADKIIIINDGKIQNIGKHEELLQIDELYKSIYNIQNAFNDGE